MSKSRVSIEVIRQVRIAQAQSRKVNAMHAVHAASEHVGYSDVPEEGDAR